MSLRVARDQIDQSALSGQNIEIKPCKFPEFEVGESIGDKVLQAKILLRPESALKTLFRNDQPRLLSSIRVAWSIVLNCYTGLEDVCFGYREQLDFSDGTEECQRHESLQRVSVACLRLEREEMIKELVSKQVYITDIDRATKPGDFYNTVLEVKIGGDNNDLIPHRSGIPNVTNNDETEKSSRMLYVIIDLLALTVTFYWKSSFMARSQAMNIVSTFEKVLHDIILINDTARVGDIDVLSDRNKQQILAWNGNVKENVQRCVHEVISEQAAVQPDKEAVCAWDGAFSYRKLLSLADRLANHLMSFGVGPEIFVPLCFEKSKWTVVAMLAVLKAGGTFVPLDPTHPVARLQALTRKVGANLILCSRTKEETLQTVASQLISVDDQLFNEITVSAGEVCRGSATNGAYMIFTSGTSGEPKGALLEHGAFLSSARAHGPAMLMDSNTRSLQFAASTFDASISESLTCLILGGCVCIPSEEARLNDIEGAINTLGVNWALLTPTFVKFVDPNNVPDLKTLVTGGEAMTQSIVETWQHINLVNAYGPAEAAIVTHVHPFMNDGDSSLNIGWQVGVHCWIVDRYDHDRLMPIGAVGELIIDGNTLAREYFREPVKTSEAFISRPRWALDGNGFATAGRMYKTGDLARYNTLDGSFQFSGRKDTQIKFHGQRIELGEIEYHLNNNQAIRHGLIILPKAGFCKGRLLAVVQLCDALNQDLVPNGQPYALVSGELSTVATTMINGTKQFLGERLPPYMVPSMWLAVEHIPRVQSGKLDRKQTNEWIEMMTEDLYRRLNPTTLPEYSDDLSFATQKELDLRSIWGRVLNLNAEQVSLRQSFLSLGGDSISAMQVMSECRKQGFGLTVRHILACKSISELASCIKAINSPLYHEEAIEELFDLSPIQNLYFSRAGHSNGHFNQSFLLKTSQRVMATEMRVAIEAIVKRHSMLRARFSQTGADGEWKQRITSDINGSYRLRTLKVDSKVQIEPELADSQTCLNEISGPLFAIDLIDVHGEEQLLFLVAHHLVMDLVSWRIILQDLEELLLKTTGEPMTGMSLPYQTWCKLQAENCLDMSPQDVLPIESIPDGNAEYWGMNDAPNIYGDTVYEGFEIDASLTSSLLGQCHDALRTEIPDILLASMIHSFAEIFTDRAVPPIFTEGHGRETWDTAIDLSNVVGWFTTISPVFVGDIVSDDLPRTVKFVKDARRKIPDKGRPYFASRWLTKQGKEAFARHWPLEITFNYLGQYQQLEREGALFTPAKAIAGEVRDARIGADVGHFTPCISFFEVSAVVLKGALRFSFLFNRNMKHQDKIHQWITRCQDNLCDMIETLLNQPPQPTLSDFGLLALTYDRLDVMLNEKVKDAGIHDVGLIEDVYPCSPMQASLLVSATKNTAFYAAHTLHEVRSNDGKRVGSERLVEAWRKVVQHHPILRTIFIESVSESDSFYDQVVLKHVEPNISTQSRETDDEAVQSLSLLPTHEGNDHRLLHRLTICTSDSGRVFCRLDISHVIMDGASLSIVFRDLALAYGDVLGSGQGPQYRNFIAHLQKQPMVSGINYWKNYLKDIEPCHFPVLDDGNPVVSKELRYVRVNFKELTDLQTLCDELGVTLANAIYTAWALTLRCFVGSEEVCFGYLTSARDAPIDGIESVVGPVINMIACRANFTDDTTLEAIMTQVQQDYLDSLAFRHVPLAEVQHALQLSNAVLFNTALSYRRLPSKPFEDPSISFEEKEPTYDPDEFNVSINIEAGEDAIAIDLMYWTDTLSDKQALNVASTFDQALSNILHCYKVPISKLDYLSKHDKEQILTWNKVVPDAVQECVHDIFVRQSHDRPHAAAIDSWDGSFTYAELDAASDKLAHLLYNKGVGPESFVLTCFEKSSFAIVSMLAVLKAGGACVPLDPNHPIAALRLRAEDTGASMALVSTTLVDRLKSTVPEVLAVDASLLDSLSSRPEAISNGLKPSNACFVIYTSGSTGKPKGVVLEHQGIVTSARYHGPLLGYEQDSRVLQFASYTFDNSLAEMFTTLMRGGCVCVPSEYERMNDLEGAINRMNVTFADITPTVATYIEPTAVPTLKRLALGGEAVTKRCVEIWRDHVSLHCCYGPSECSINSTYSGEIDKPGKATNIGRALGSVTWVVDPQNHEKLMPVGCIGELLVDGPIVARGYLNLPQKTSQSFISNPQWLKQHPDQQNICNRKIYKTGDLVRYDSDGTLQYLGRKDTQVKLNGQRIELGEIEHHIEKGLSEAAQSAVELVSFGGQKALTCFIHVDSNGTVANGSITEATSESLVLQMTEDFKKVAKDLEINISTKVPSYMVPTVWIPVLQMPLTSSGKLNRRALRLTAQDISTTLLPTYKLATKSGREPSSDIEKSLATIWAQILNIEVNSIGVEDSFFKLGGDSVGAMRLVTVARKSNISLTVANIFQKPSLYDMAESASPLSMVSTSEAAPFSLLGSRAEAETIRNHIGTILTLNARDIEDIYPCTAIQEGLMALSLKEPGAYVAQLSYRLPIGTDIRRFKEAWSSVVRTEAVLRTRIVYIESHGFLQVVVNQPILWSIFSSKDEMGDSLRRLPKSNGGEIVQYSIAGSSETGYHFIWTIHHALYDGHSLPLFLNRAKTYYDGAVSARLHNGPSYATFLKYLGNVKQEESNEYWRTKLEGVSAIQFPRLPNASYQANGSSLLTKSANIKRRVGSEITIATLIRAAWTLLVASYSGSQDVVFWETLTGRDAPLTGIEDMAGPTLSTVPRRFVIDQSCSVLEFLKIVQGQSVEAMLHQYTGIHKIKRLSQDAEIACEAQNLIAINNGSKGDSDDFWIAENEDMAGTNFYTYPIMLSCNVEEETVGIDAHYDENIVSSWLMNQILYQLVGLLERINVEANDDEQLRSLSLLSDNDRQSITNWNGDYPVIIEKCIHELITHQVHTQGPSKPAVCSREVSLTYGELDELSTKLSHELLNRGLTAGSLVPICFDKSVWVVVSMIAILKSGGAFVPLDPNHPDIRVKGILDDSEAKILLCSPKYATRFQGLVHNVLSIYKRSFDLFSEVAPNLPSTPSSAAAYVIFTSGTTGKPKGTIVEHAAFCTSAVAHGSVMQMNESSRVLQFASYTFDASIMEILTTLIMGGTVCVPDDEERLHDISGAIRDLGVNWALLTPSFAQTISPASIPGFRTLVLGGEAMSSSHIETWSGHVRLMNAYGPSETAVIAAINPHVTTKTGPFNIGGNVGGINWVTDPGNHDRLAPVGAVGELVVEGPILARGYLKNTIKTNEAFITDPIWSRDNFRTGSITSRRMYMTGDLVKYTSDGSLIFQGRKDNQAKIRGQRLELSEVEHHLSTDEKILHSIALIPQTGRCAKKLVAVVSPKSQIGDADTSGDIAPITGEIASSFLMSVRNRMSSLVPAYMVPSKWILLDEIPLLPSGKLDRRRVLIWIDSIDEETYERISQAEEARIPLDRELSDLEDKIRSIWAKALNLSPTSVSTDRSFVHLGGDSISAMQVMASCRSHDVEVTVPQIMQSNSFLTLAAMARAVESIVYVPEEVEKLFDLSPIQKMYFEHMAKTAEQFNQSVLLKANQRIKVLDFANIMHEIIQSHSMLRARFSQDAHGAWSQRVTADTSASYRFRSHLITSRQEIEPLVRESQCVLDFVKGPVFAIEFFELQDDNEQIVALIAHHLIIDVVSWNVIVNDIENMFNDREIKTQSHLQFQAWCALQSNQAERDEPFSQAFPELQFPSIDLDYWGMAGRSNIHGETETEIVRFDVSTTDSFLRSCNHALQTDSVDILLAVLLASLNKTFTDRSRIPAIFNEGHGREPWDPRIDLSRTVGWFTTLCPVFLPESVQTNDSVIDIIRWVKDFRAKIADKGRSYFAKRYLTETGLVRYGHDWPVEIAFNYLGRALNGENNDGFFSAMNASETEKLTSGSDIGHNVPRISLFEITALVENNELKVAFSFNKNMSRQNNIKHWIRGFDVLFREAVQYLSVMEFERTMSDFKLLPLQYRGLEQLKSRLAQVNLSITGEVEDVYPCSPVQQGILFTQMKNSSYYAYSVTFKLTTTISGEQIGIQRLIGAWNEVCQRHSILRTIFVDNVFGDGELHQLVLRKIVPDVRLQWKSSTQFEMSAQGSRLDLSMAKVPHRFTICQTSKNTIYGQLELSHAISDGTSMPIIFHDLMIAYEGSRLNQPNALKYNEYIGYLQRLSKQNSLEYWKTYLDKSEPCYFPSLVYADTEQRELACHVEDLPNVPELQAFCTDNGYTLSNVLQFVWGLILQAYTGFDEVYFGCLVAGRDAPIEAIDEAVGVFINMIPCKISLNPSASIDEVIRQIQTDFANSLSHQNISLAEIQHQLGMTNTPLFNTAYSFQKRSNIKPFSSDAVHLEILDAEDPSEYDLTVNIEVWETKIDFQLAFWTDKISQDHVKNIASCYSRILSQITHSSNANRKINDLDLLSIRCMEQITQWNNLEPETINDCVHRVFEQNALQLPHDANAICGWDLNLTYQQLDTMASQFAIHLNSLGVRPSSYVPLCFEKSAWAIVAMIGVLKSGAAFVPLDLNFPEERLKYLVESVEASFVVCSPKLKDRFERCDIQTIPLDKTAMEKIPRRPARYSNPVVAPHDPAYIIFTSGTTGLPKGTVIEHSAFTTGALAHAKAIKMGPSSRVLQFASYTFDASIMEILSCLLVGGCVCVPSNQDRMNNLAAVINKMSVNWTLLTPSVASVLKPESVPGLQVLVTGGEAMSRNHIEKWMGTTCLVNAYGPSETSVIATTSLKVNEGGQVLNRDPSCIGYPVGCRAWIVDPRNHSRLMPIGGIGELVVEGPIVARGYLKNDQKTKDSFINYPVWRSETGLAENRLHRMYKTGDLVRQDLDGSIIYMGRKDTQIKINGQRIELGEIEHHVRMHVGPQIQFAVDLVVPQSRTTVKALAVFLSDDSKAFQGGKQSTKRSEDHDILLPVSDMHRDIGTGLKAALEIALPAYMVPSMYVPVTRMPWTSSGKLDRQRLRSAIQQVPTSEIALYKLSSASKRVAPSTSIEKQLQRLWAQVLLVKADTIFKDDNFFRVGGDSITAMQLVTAAQAERLSLSVMNIFKNPQLSNMATACRVSEETRIETNAKFSLISNKDRLAMLLSELSEKCYISPSQIEDSYPCSPLQEGLITLTLKQKGAYVASNVFKIPQNVDILRFKTAWQRTVDCTDILRTRIVYTQSNQFYQVITESQAIDWKSASCLEQASEMASLVPEHNGGVLTQYTIVGSSANEPRYFVWTIHHALYDAWSFNKILGLVEEMYHNRKQAFNATPYSSFIKYLGMTDQGASKEFWKSNLEGASPSHFPLLSTSNLEESVINKSIARTMKFSRTSNSTGITNATMIRAAWALMLGSRTGSDSVVFGETLSGRDIALPGIPDLVGPTLTTIPNCVKIDRSASVQSFLQLLQDCATEVIPFQHTGLQNIKQAIPNDSIVCDFNNLLVIQSSYNSQENTLLMPTENNLERNFFTYPLVLECTVNPNDLEFISHYNEAIIPTWQINGILNQLEHLVHQLTVHSSNPERKIRDIESPSPHDLDCIRNWNSSSLLHVDQTITDLIVNKVHEHPEKTAIHSFEGTFSYQYVYELALQMARFLRDKGVGDEMFVPVCMDKSALTAMAMLGVLLSGGAVVPLDPSHPPSRHHNIIKDSNASVVLCSPGYSTRFVGKVHTVVPVDKNFFLNLSSQSSRTKPAGPSSSRNAAFVIYTSGSTGQPKGVVIEHHTFCSSTRSYMQTTCVDQSSQVYQFASYAFDISMGEMFGTLSIGACVCIPSEEMRTSDLAGSMSALGATWVFLTPSVANIMDPLELKSLKTLVCGGEALTIETVNKWADRVQLMNGYGPAECTIFAVLNSHVSTQKDHHIIGRGHQSGRTWIVDPRDHNVLLPIGCVGELLIEGPLVSRGYLNDKEKTDSVFVKNPAWAKSFGHGAGSSARFYKSGDLVAYDSKGHLRFIGRKDHQVKLHGQRMELSEIQVHIESDIAVKHALVLLPKSGRCQQRLTAVISLNNLSRGDTTLKSTQCLPIPSHQKHSATATIRAIKDALLLKLPDFMVPTIWLVMERIPLMVSGKLDRTVVMEWIANLDNTDFERAHISDIESESEELQGSPGQEIIRIVSSVLNVPMAEIETNRSFISLGGDSISAMQVLSRFREANFSISLQQILRAKSIAHLTKSLVHTGHDSRVCAENEPEVLEQNFPLSPIQRLFFENSIDKDRGDQFNQSFLLRITKKIDQDDLGRAIRVLLEKHSMLRARFTLDDQGNWQQYISKDINSSYRYRVHVTKNNSDLIPIIAKSQRRIDIKSGPLFVVDLFNLTDGMQILSLIAHHLVVDVVSWLNIIRALESSLLTSVHHTRPPTTFRSWIAQQVEQCRSSTASLLSLLPAGKIFTDISYWGMENKPNVYGDVNRASFTIPGKEFVQLATNTCHDALGTEPIDLFISAISASFSRTFADRETSTIFNEGHGRESWDQSIDISESVGWFTTICPVPFDAPQDKGDLIDTIRRVKDARVKIPGNGRPYFAYRYLTSSGRNACNDHMPMEILFNFLGRKRVTSKGDSLLESFDFDKTDEEALTISDVGTKTARLALFEISAEIADDGVHVSFFFNKNMKHQQRIRDWAASCRSILQMMVEQLAKAKKTPTLSDLPLMPINYAELQKLVKKSLPAAGIEDYKDIEDIYPCSPMQTGMLLGQLKDKSRYLFHTIVEVIPLKPNSNVDANRLADACAKVVERHSALRTVFINSVYRNGTFDQAVLRSPLRKIVRLTCQEAQVTERLNALTLKDANAGSGPRLPYQFAICETTSGKVYFKIEMNHAVVDGASTTLIVDEIVRLYTDGVISTEPVPYKKYVEYIAATSLDSSISYWKQYLQGVVPTNFPLLNPDLTVERTLKETPLRFERFSELHNLCAQGGFTLPNVMLTAWALILRSYTKSDDVCFGYLSSGRDIPIDGVEDIIGPFINMLTLRFRLTPQMLASGLFLEAQEDFLSSLPHQHCSLARVQHELGMANKTLFNTALSIQSSKSGQDPQQKGITFESIASHDPSEYAITLNINTTRSDEGIMVRYYSDVLSDSQATELMNSLAALLHDFIDLSHATLAQLRLFSVKENLGAVNINASSQNTITLDTSTLQRIIAESTREAIQQLLRDGFLQNQTSRESKGATALGALELQDDVMSLKLAAAKKLSNEDARRDELAGKLMHLWKEVLALGDYEISLQDSFFELGGDSIIAMSMVGIAREENMPLTVADVFEHPRFSDMLYCMQTNSQNDDAEADSTDEGTVYSETRSILVEEENYEPFSLLEHSNPESFIQDFITPLVRVFRGGIADVLPTTDFQALAIAGSLLDSRWMLNYFYLDGSGPIDLRALKQSVSQVVQSYDILRTVFVPHGKQYLQVVLRNLQPEVAVYDEVDDIDAFSTDFELKNRKEAPHLGESYIQFAVALQKDSSRHRIFLRISHAQYDGVCFPAIVDALRAGYQSEQIPPTPSFAKFVRNSVGKITPEHYTYWQDLLRGSTMTNLVHRDRPTYNMSANSTKVLKKTVPLRSLNRLNVTSATIVKAAWSMALARATAQPDIVFGHIISGRNCSVPGIESIVGPCLNMVPVRVTYQSSWTVLDLLKYVQSQQVRNMPYETLGFREIIKKCTDWDDWTNFSTILQHQSMSQTQELSIGGNVYTMGAMASQEDFADFSVITTPKDSSTVEVCLIYAEHGAITLPFAEQIFASFCDSITSFSMEPNAALPSPSDIRTMQSEKLEDTVARLRPDAASLDSALQSLSKRELFMLSDSLGRAWNQILREENDKPLDTALDSSFFKLGGDIIGLAHVATILQSEGYKIRLEDLINNPVMADQLALLSLDLKREQAQSKRASKVEVAEVAEEEGAKRMTLWRRSAKFASRMVGKKPKSADT